MRPLPCRGFAEPGPVGSLTSTHLGRKRFCAGRGCRASVAEVEQLRVAEEIDVADVDAVEILDAADRPQIEIRAEADVGRERGDGLLEPP